jgi:hypothetical protein
MICFGVVILLICIFIKYQNIMNDTFFHSIEDLVADFLASNGIDIGLGLETRTMKINEMESKLKSQKDVMNHLIQFMEQLNSFSGSNQQFNLFPASQTGPCSSLLICIASLGFDAKYYPKKKAAGFKYVILSAIRTWFYCSGTNTKNLIITADWNPQKFETLYKPIIDSYCLRFDTEVQIYEQSTRGLWLRYPY